MNWELIGIRKGIVGASMSFQQKVILEIFGISIPNSRPDPDSLALFGAGARGII